MVFGFWKRRMAILSEADEYMESFGDLAYAESRYEARKAMLAGDHKRERFMRKVCKEIAKRTDFEIGIDTATRYMDKQEPYLVDGPPLVIQRPDDATLH